MRGSFGSVAGCRSVTCGASAPSVPKPYTYSIAVRPPVALQRHTRIANQGNIFFFTQRNEWKCHKNIDVANEPQQSTEKRKYETGRRGKYIRTIFILFFSPLFFNNNVRLIYGCAKENNKFSLKCNTGNKCCRLSNIFLNNKLTRIFCDNLIRTISIYIPFLLFLVFFFFANARTISKFNNKCVTRILFRKKDFSMTYRWSNKCFTALWNAKNFINIRNVFEWHIFIIKRIRETFKSIQNEPRHQFIKWN